MLVYDTNQKRLPIFYKYNARSEKKGDRKILPFS